MSQVAPTPPALPSAAAEALAGLDAALAEEAAQHKVKAIEAMVFSKDLKELWHHQVGSTPGFIRKVLRAKAKSFVHGRPLANPGQCNTMCCYLMPWCCGCTSHMAVQGAVGIQIAELDAEGFVVSGAPAGATDLKICEDSLKKIGFVKDEQGKFHKGGAPPAQELERN